MSGAGIQVSGRIDIRAMSPAELQLSAEWAALEGWTRGLGDAGAFRAADPARFRLFAPASNVPSDLFDALAHATPPNESVVLDVPEPNAAAIALAARQGPKPVFETTRMVRGEAAPLPLGRIFGVVSFERG